MRSAPASSGARSKSSSRQSRVPSTSSSGGRVGQLDVEAPVEEQEDRLGLDSRRCAAGGAAPPGSADACARAGARVRSRTARPRARRRRRAARAGRRPARRSPRRAATTPARPRVRGSRRPASRGTGARPPRPTPAGSGGGRCTGSRETSRSPLLGRHGVVGRGDEIGRRAGRAGVADGAERLQIGHPARAYQRPIAALQRCRTTGQTLHVRGT